MSDSSATPWTVAHQVPLSMEFPGKNTGVGCHFLLQGILLIQEPKSPTLAGGFFYQWATWEKQQKALFTYYLLLYLHTPIKM